MAGPKGPSPAELSKSNEELLARLDRMSTEFGESLGERVKEVRRVWSLVPEAPVPGEARDALVKIHDIVHTLAGAGKSFGFPQVSTAAAPLDGLFRLVREQKQTLSREEMAQIELLVQGLEQAICSPRVALTLEGLKPAPTADTRGKTHVLVLAKRDNDEEAVALRNAIANYGYPCAVIGGSWPLPVEVTAGAPAVVVADVTDGASHLDLVRGGSIFASHPLVLTSRHTGFAERLQAVRLGATLFLPQPLEIEELVDHIATIEDAHAQRPYRVVITEDEPSLAQFYQLTLEHAGMETRVVRRPSHLLDTLSGFDPDLILMDLYMPECSGLELAQMVRQFPAYTTVPILFLSTEARLDLQLRARHLGGDDFLPKPLQPGQLISAVTSRANRYRDLKKLTDRDSLTGLLNHTNILRTLGREAMAAARTNAPMAVAMIDIDHFKAINDTYGHAVGDQVIVRLTHLLRNRLRRIDYVGRYGGEEFAVVMPNTDAAAAKVVLDGLREAAAAVPHHADNKTFNVTFSAGIAAFPAYTDPVKLVDAADAALYRAKRGGRNRIEIA